MPASSSAVDRGGQDLGPRPAERAAAGGWPRGEHGRTERERDTARVGEDVTGIGEQAEAAGDEGADDLDGKTMIATASAPARAPRCRPVAVTAWSWSCRCPLIAATSVRLVCRSAGGRVTVHPRRADPRRPALADVAAKAVPVDQRVAPRRQGTNSSSPKPSSSLLGRLRPRRPPGSCSKMLLPHLLHVDAVPSAMLAAVDVHVVVHPLGRASVLVASLMRRRGLAAEHRAAAGGEADQRWRRRRPGRSPRPGRSRACP